MRDMRKPYAICGARRKRKLPAALAACLLAFAHVQPALPQIVNSVTVKGNANGVEITTTDEATVTVAHADPRISLFKTGAFNDGGDGKADVGDVINYRFTVTNTGNVSIRNITISDPLVPVTGGPLAELAPGRTDTTTFTAVYHLTQADIDAGAVSNTATISGTDPAGNPVTAVDGDTTALIASAGLTLAKAGTLNDGGDGRADAGDTIFYQFVVTNTGPTTLTNIKITDPLLDLAERAAAAKALVQVDGLVGDSDPIMTASTGEGLRTTIVDGSPASPGPAGSESSDTFVSQPHVPLPPLPLGIHASRSLVQFTGTPGMPEPGDLIGILYSLTNTGEAPLLDIEVSDPSSKIFNDRLDRLAPGETSTGSVLFTRRLSEDEAKAGVIMAEARVTSRARNEQIITAANGPLLLGGMEHADMLETAAISPAAVTSLAPGDQAVFSATYTLTQADIDAGHIDNVAVASGNDPSGATLQSVDSVEVPLTHQPSIAVVKAGSADLGADLTATIGDLITYRFTVRNTGNVTLTNVTVTDPLVTVTGGPIAVLPPGAENSSTFTATYAITQADLDAGEVRNQATATASTPTAAAVSDLSGSRDVTGDDPTVTSLTPTSSIGLVKSVASTTDVNGNGVTDAGDQLNYVFSVTNTGNMTLTNVTVTDPLVAVTGGPIPQLSPGEVNSTVFRATYVLTQADIDAGEVSNQATATAIDPNGDTVTDQSDGTSVTADNPTITPIITAPRIALVKAVSAITDSNGNGVNDVGDVITYAFTVTNTGNVTLNQIAVTDPLVTVSGGPLPNLAPGESNATTFTARYVITAADATAGRVVNQATVTGTTPAGANIQDLSDNSSVDEDDPTVTPVTVLPAIALVKQVEAISDVNGNGLTDAGDTIDYGFTVTNTGNVTLTNVTLTDPLVTVSGGPIATLDPDRSDTTTFTASYVITGADVIAGRVTNQAMAYGTAPSGAVVSDRSDGESTSEDDPTVTLLSSTPGIALVKTVTSVTDANGNGMTDRGDIIHYGFAVTNTGNVALTDVVVTDLKVPVAGGPLASLAVSETDGTSFTASYVITQADVDAGEVRNQATASGRTPTDVLVTDVSDGVSINGNEPTITAIQQQPSIALVKTVSSIRDINGNGDTDAGDVISYAFAVTNTGNQTLSNVTLSDPLIPVQGGPIAALPPGMTDSATFTARYRVTAGDALAGQVSNQATVTALTPSGATITDLSDDNEIAGNDPTVTPVVQISAHFSKTALDPEVRRGERASFVIAASDAGPGPLSITDIMPPGFTFVAGSAAANGTAVRPAIYGRNLVFHGLRPDASGKVTLKLSLRTATSLQTGRFINRAALHDRTGVLLASAQASVSIIEEHVFDCGDVIGRVFDDKNRNGYADDGEPGLPGVRVATVKGLLVTTDKHGRFHVPCADVPDATTGSNFIMKLDTRTLPSGYVVTTENPRVVRLTRGKVTKLNFGASILRQVMLELKDDAFAGSRSSLKPEWHQGIAHLIRVLEQEPSILRLTYESDTADSAMASQRLSAVRSLIANEWKRRDGGYRLVIDARAMGRD